MTDDKARDKAEKLIRLSQSNHDNEANMAARAACKLILDNRLSLYDSPGIRTMPGRVVQVMREVRVPVMVADPESYDRGFRAGHAEGYTEAMRLLPPAPPKETMSAVRFMSRVLGDL